MTTVAASTASAVRLRRDATASARDDGSVSLATPQGSILLKDVPPGIADAFAALAIDDRSDEELAAIVTARDGELGLLRLHMVMRRLDAGGLLEHAVYAAGVAIARLRSVGRGRVVVGAVSDTPVRLSRFAAAHVDGGVVVVRAPGSHLAVELHPSATSLLGALAEWTTPSELAEASAEMPVASVLPLLAAAGLLAPGRPGRDEEAEQQRLAQWSVDELWLHASSRGPKTVAGYGGTYRHGRRFRPEPVLPSAFSGPRVALTVPDLAAVAHRDPSLTEVLEQRRSVREHDADAPITAGQLGELLYRTVRLRQTFVGSDGQELADRPYPSGGAVHELEVYPLVTQAADLQPGLWHYATGDHTLEYVAEPGQATTALIDGARAIRPDGRRSADRADRFSPVRPGHVEVRVGGLRTDPQARGRPLPDAVPRRLGNGAGGVRTWRRRCRGFRRRERAGLLHRGQRRGAGCGEPSTDIALHGRRAKAMTRPGRVGGGS